VKFTKGQIQQSGKTFSFVASTASQDRMGDVIRQDGWDLKAYKNNPVVLFGHNHDQPIGRAHNVRVHDGALKADFEFAPEGVNPFAAQVGRMVEAGFLKAVSVGFRPLEYKPMKSGGLEFIKSELLEISVVSVPANSEAVAFAKSFASDDDIRRLFAGQSSEVRKRVATARIKATLASYGEIAISPRK
jgi:HK97 family phage prohead protease